MGLAFVYEEGQTPLNEDESEGLLAKTITTQHQLNEVEQLNIEEAIEWTLRKKFALRDILNESFSNDLHKKMFGSVWKWAGDYRKTNKNIGVDKYQIATSLRNLRDDCKFWIDNKTFSEDEIAIRFKHRIVSIHCYSNGNGRHSRLIADIIASHVFRKPVFTWGSASLRSSEARTIYIKALKKADQGDISDLIDFARS